MSPYYKIPYIILQLFLLSSSFTLVDSLKEIIWDQSSPAFQPDQAIGHKTFQNWEVSNNFGKYSVCNEDTISKIPQPVARDAIQNYLISPKLKVPQGASFLQVNYSMAVAKNSRLNSEVLKVQVQKSYDDSYLNSLTSGYSLNQFEDFEFINGEYFEILDGNAVLTIPVDDNTPYLFIAFFDSGYCGSLTIHSVHTNFCPETQTGSIILPKTYSKVSNTRVELYENQVTCAPNSQLVSWESGKQILKFCLFGGTWKSRTPVTRDSEFCACNPGFFASSHDNTKSVCTRCSSGEIKGAVGNHYCQACPANSGPNYDQTFCDCHSGFYRSNVTNPRYKCHQPPTPPSKVLASVQFTDVILSWREPSQALGQYYSLECTSCSEDSNKPFQSFSHGHIRKNEVVLRNLEPETTYRLLLKVYSDIVIPNQLRVPSIAVEFTTSFRLAVDSPVVEINGDRLNVEWSRPLQANQGMRLKYKVKVDVGEHKSFSSGELDSIYYSYPLPVEAYNNEILTIRIGVVYNNTIFWGDEIFASPLSSGHGGPIMEPGVTRYIMAIGIMFSMLLLVGILVCGVICMVHRTRSIAKYEQQLWTHTLPQNLPPANSLYDFNSFSQYNINTVHAFMEPSFYEDYFGVMNEFCAILPPNAVQMGKQLSDSLFEGEIVNAIYGQTPTSCAVKLLTPDMLALDEKRHKRRFVIEAATMSQFHHCNVQKIYGLVYSAEPCYLEMALELCSRGSLHDVLRTTPFWGNNQHSTVYFLLRGIVHGMEYLHDLGYIHKVLKAQNVQVTHNNVAKISGFEDRAYLEENDTALALDELDLVPWQPVEVIKQNKFSPAADVYSFAILFWEVINDCNSRPFDNATSKEVAFRTCEGKRPMLSKDTPSWVETLITSCWTDDQFRRPMFCNIRQQIDSMIVNNQATLPSKGPLAANGGNSEASPNALYVSPSRFTQLSAAQPAFHYDVTQWLSSLKLDKLAPIFEKFGLRSLEQVSNLKEADLVAIPELTSKQRKKILNSISSFNTPRAGTLFGGMQQTPVNNLYLTDKMYDFREHGV